MNSSPLQQVLQAGKNAFANGQGRMVPKQYANFDLFYFAFLKGFDEMAALQSKKKEF